MKKKLLLIICMGLLSFGAANNIEAATVPFNHYYEASVVPDHSSLQNIFSTIVQSGTNWSASEGILTLSTTYMKGLWFGNNPDYDAVPWDIGDYNEGNMVSIRSKLGENSGEWQFYLYDGNYVSGYYFLEDSVEIIGYGIYEIDTSEYHDYFIQLGDGLVQYKIDDSIIYSGAAIDSTHGKRLLIGDGGSSSNTGYGSMLIDEVTIQTHAGAPVPIPGAVWLLGSGLASLVVAHRKKRS